MTYPEALRYLSSFINYEELEQYDYKRSFKLDRMSNLSALLGDPQKEVRAIHIAGTKGKGSTAAMVHSILKSANFKVGLYTSPHLVSFRERIRVGDDLISEDETCELLEEIKPIVDKMVDAPTFFEIYTALAYLYFKEKKVDCAIYETGLGGRLDATNVVSSLISSITPISYEHTQKLGHTLKEIATEKAGIIKDDTICVSAPQDEEALKVIDDICEERDTRLVLVGRDLLFEELNCSDRETIFNVFGMFGEYPMLSSGLLGPHQVLNATLAVGIVEALRFWGVVIDSYAIRRGIEETKWGGRLEVVGRSPLVVLDGAQNRASANALAKAVKKIFKFSNLILVLGVSKDKDVKGMLEELLPLSNSVVLTKSRVAQRAFEPSEIKRFITSDIEEVVLTSNVEEALNKARAMASREDLILITGSLFVVGEARAFLCEEKVWSE